MTSVEISFIVGFGIYYIARSVYFSAFLLPAIPVRDGTHLSSTYSFVSINEVRLFWKM